MKLKLLTSFFLFVLAFSIAKATVHVVTCQNSPSHFLAVTVYATVGDTIHWTWVAGDHVVGPVNTSDIPAGAAMFNGPIDQTHLNFQYVVTVPGHYHYVCHPATPHGEDAYIEVSSATATGIAAPTGNASHSAAFPNPFADHITIQTPSADHVLVYNALGALVKSWTLSSGQTQIEADMANLPKGIFFYSVLKEGAVVETRKIIKAW